MAPDPSSYIPLKPVWLQIMLSMAAGPSHGYAIRKEVEERTNGKLQLWPTTLYGAIGQLDDAGLIEEAEADTNDDERRRTYTLTALGRRVLEAEAARLESLAALARARTRPV